MNNKEIINSLDKENATQPFQTMGQCDLSDQEIIKGLIEKDNRVTTIFFFTNCRPLFYSIIKLVFEHKVDYDELVNELYVYLMEDDAQKLRTFQFRCSVYNWLKILAIHFFVKKKNLFINEMPHPSSVVLNQIPDREIRDVMAKGDLERLFKQMRTERYVYVLRKLLIEDQKSASLAKEMRITTDNLYNIKMRAIAQLTRVALNDIKEYGK